MIKNANKKQTGVPFRRINEKLNVRRIDFTLKEMFTIQRKKNTLSYRHTIKFCKDFAKPYLPLIYKIQTNKNADVKSKMFIIKIIRMILQVMLDRRILIAWHDSANFRMPK